MTSSRRRTSDSPLQLPSAGQVARLVGRAAWLRCPHCGNGAVMKWSGAVTGGVAAATRFERSDESYFSGAMFFGF